jgi:DNA polymerase elongation subunit (family B)
MLDDILKTRVMVKNSMKLYDDDNLYKIFDSRQLSLKLIANVTFGYTAANYSGRMPCVEVREKKIRWFRIIIWKNKYFNLLNFRLEIRLYDKQGKL